MSSEAAKSSLEVAALRRRVEELEEALREARQAEDAAVRQHQWLQITLASIGDAVITTDEQGFVNFINPVAEALTGWSAHDARGQRLDDVFNIVNEETRQAVESPVARVIREGMVVGFANHTILISRDGEQRPIEDSAAPIRDSQGRLCGVVLVFRDNSAQKKTEDFLRSNRHLLRNVLDHTPAGIYMKTQSGRMMLVNRRFAELLRRPMSEIVGRTDAELFAPEYLQDILLNDREAFATGRTVQFEERLQLPDGQHTFLSIKAPIPEFDGVEPVLIGIMTDVTEAKQAREEVSRLYERERQHTSRLTQLSRALHTIHSALSLDSVLLVITEEARRIIGAHQAVSTMTVKDDWANAINTVSLSQKYAAWQTYDNKPTGVGIYTTVCRNNQSVRLTQADLEAHPEWRGFSEEAERHPPLRGWLAAPFVARDGRNLGLIQLSDKSEGEFTEEDESILVQLASMASVALENARLYEELREGDRRKDEFLAMLAHELRNPLAPLRNALVLLGMEHLDEETAQQARDIMTRQVDHMGRLVDDLLDVSRIMRGKIELRKEPVEAATIVNRAVETAMPLIQLQQHELIVELPPEPIWIDADVVRMAQVISNLLNNAAKYTPAGGKIWVQVERRHRGVAFHVRDTGVGIEPQLLPRIFDLFTQSERSIERSQGGLGIGLTLVRNLVEMHGGSVAVSSPGPGLGTEFLVALPTLAAHQKREAQPWQPSPIRQLRVLVVEDLVGSAKLLAAMLRKFWGHEVLMAHDGLEALQVAKSFRPELVLLDIGLPGISGFEVARRLRQMPETENSLLVALTGYGTNDDRRKARDAGFDEHLVKPSSVESLQQLFTHAKLAAAAPPGDAGCQPVS
jgi:PAS domain S-box-containing protein